VTSRAVVATLNGHTRDVNALALSPDGRLLASGSGDGTVILWDVERHAHLKTLTDHNDRVTSVAFSHDGRTLASGSPDGSIIFWDVKSQRRVARTTFGHDFLPEKVMVGGSSDTIVAFNDSSTNPIWVFDLGAERIAQRICGTLRRNLTLNEWETFVPHMRYSKACG